MPINDLLLTVGAQAMANAATHATVNSTYPDATGATAATPRQPITWNAAANGDLTLATVENFTGGTPSANAAGVGLWNADGSVYYGDVQRTTGDATLNAAGEYDLQSITLTGSAS